MLSQVNCITSTSTREKTQVKRQHLVDGVLFVLLVLVGAQARIWLQDLPNFAPVAGLALFAGYFFRSWLLALCLPLSVMAISDLSIGGYDWRMMAVVYGMLAVPVAFRPLLRRYLNLDQGGLKSASLAVTGLVGCSLGASVLFFLTTNFGSWLWFNMYEHSLGGPDPVLRHGDSVLPLHAVRRLVLCRHPVRKLCRGCPIPFGGPGPQRSGGRITQSPRFDFRRAGALDVRGAGSFRLPCSTAVPLA